LRRRPRRELAIDAAPILAAARQYDAVPVLIRYGMLGDDACLRAVEAMEVPQAALARLIVARESGEILDWSDRQRIAKLLGRDAGWRLSDWIALYHSVALTLPTPLSPQQSAEAERVISAIERFSRAMNERRDGSVTREMVDWDAPDIEAELQRVLNP
jgi:hypothetical protein